MGVIKYLKLIILIAALPFIMSACRKAGGDYPGNQYTYDMISSRAYETYSMNSEMRDNMSAIPPVPGTVPYIGDPISGKSGDSLKMSMNLPYSIPNTPEGYEKSGLDIKNPFTIADKNVVAEGERFYMIYCSICHGTSGEGNGYIVTEGKYSAPPPSYFEPAIMALPEGKMFHVVTYGKGAMQSYSYALSKEERWKVITYIKQLQADYSVNNTTDSTSKSASAVVIN